MKKNKFSLNNLFKDNRVVFVIALVASIAIWIAVSPNRSISVPVSLNIDTANTAVGELGLEILEGQGQKIDVEIEGKWYVISEVQETDIKLNVALNDITKAGEYELHVSATNQSNADFNIVRVTPETVKVKFDYIYTRSFKIDVRANGVKAAEGLIAGSPVLSTNETNIEITGPKSVVETIGSVSAEVDVNATLRSSTSYTSKLNIFKTDGELLTSEEMATLTLPFTEVNITIPINKSKTVPVNVNFSNQPAYYRQNPLSYTSSVSEINLIGTTEVMDTFDSIELDPIDFLELGPDNNVFQFDLKLPSGVRSVDDIDQITVTVDTSGIASKTLDASIFQAVNMPAGKTVSVVTSRKSVVVVGPSDVISSLAAEDVYLEYDLSNTANSTGEMVVDATLKSDRYVSIWSYGKVEVQIRLS